MCQPPFPDYGQKARMMWIGSYPSMTKSNIQRFAIDSRLAGHGICKICALQIGFSDVHDTGPCVEAFMTKRLVVLGHSQLLERVAELVHGLLMIIIDSHRACSAGDGI